MEHEAIQKIRNIYNNSELKNLDLDKAEEVLFGMKCWQSYFAFAKELINRN